MWKQVSSKIVSEISLWVWAIRLLLDLVIQYENYSDTLLCASDKVLQDGVEGPCLHRPGSWLMRQLNDEPKQVYKVGFIREKGKARARALQWSPEAGNLLLG
jgi:hypothetical protein